MSGAALPRLFQRLAVAAALSLSVLSGPALAQSAQAAGAPKIVEFVEQEYALPSTVEAREQPAAEAAVLVRLRQGLRVKVIGVVEGDAWLQIELPDKRLAYVPSAAIPAVTSAAAASPPAAPASPAPLSAPATAGGAGLGSAGAPGGAPAPAEQAANENLEAAATADLPGLVEFRTVDQAMRVERSTPVYIAPNRDAPQVYSVREGVLVEVVALSKDDGWAWVTTENDVPAYIATADLALVSPEELSQIAAAFPATVSGRATVQDSTARLKVGDREIELFGVEGVEAPFTTRLQELIDARGRTVECRRKVDRYSCTLTGNVDLAQAALQAGLARPDSTATAEYVAAANSAREGKRGAWAN